ncbi:MAG: hypothetical protein HY721_08700 [Planctomycetes bacterium]|nr:hypothetical protein [Planctomycetota bacterium]
MKRERIIPSGILFCALFLLGGRASAENSLEVGNGSAKSGAVADVPLLLSGDGDVQGFVMVFEWDAAKAKGVDLVPNDGAGKPLNGADLIEKRVVDGFMILAAVMDIDGRDGEKIPKGDDTVVGTAKIRCEGPARGTETIALRLVDNKYARVDGGPLLSNIISIGGRSIGAGEGLRLRNGTLECQGEVVEPGEVVFACGGPLDRDGKPTDLKAPKGSKVTVNFYYKAPASGAGNKDKIQGLSMAVKYSCDLGAIPDSFSLEGGALKDVNAEFVHLEVDNNNPKSDKDGCELTVGVLVDATAPYDGRTLPPTASFRKLFAIDFEIEPDATCGKCYWLKFTDGLNGNGDVPVKNLVSINFQSQAPQLMNCAVCVEGSIVDVKFIRGDCNFSGMVGMAVDIADAAAAVGYLFLTGDAKFDAPCDDACDANDDGRLDAADVVFILNYLFVANSPKPPAPGPLRPGKDPTPDSLGCKGGEADC